MEQKFRSNHPFQPRSNFTFENAGTDTLMTTNFIQKEWQQTQDSTTGWELLEYLRQLLETEKVSIAELQYLPFKGYVNSYKEWRSQHPSNPSFSTCNIIYSTHKYWLTKSCMVFGVPCVIVSLAPFLRRTLAYIYESRQLHHNYHLITPGIQVRLLIY